MAPHQNKTAVSNYLNSKCPVRISRKDIFYGAIFEFVFVFLIIVILRPYLMKELSIGSLFEVALTSAFIFGFFNLFYSVTSKTINIETWTYKMDLIRFSQRFFIVGTVFLWYAYYATNYIYVDEINFPVTDFYLTSIAYIFFIAGLYYFFEKFITYFKTQHQVSSLEETENKILKETSVIFYGKNKEEFVETTMQNLVYIQSIGHYLKFFIKSEINETVEIQIIRNSIQTIYSETEKFNNLFRCHRSYIINVNEIKNIEGNSQKASIVLNSIDDKIPISRVSYKSLKENLCI